MRLARVLQYFLLICALACAASAQTVGEMFASDASVRGSVLFASGGTQIQSGSSVSAGDAAAVLKLKRGGELRICPKTTVSVSASTNGRDLLWGMNVGSVEAHFDLPASADTIMTPDFRILLAGPGTFHFAISSNTLGDACMKALGSNTASLIVTELYGSGTYQVKPNEQVVFHGGNLDRADGLVPPDCGCPPPKIPMQQAQATPVKPPSPAPSIAQVPPAPVVLDLPQNRFEAAKTATPFILPPPDDPHVQMEAPFVYSPADPDQEMVMAVSRLRLTSGSSFVPAEVSAPTVPVRDEPPKIAVAKSVQKGERKGFFGKIGSFFAAIFR
jgi:hypothetical protein